MQTPVSAKSSYDCDSDSQVEDSTGRSKVLYKLLNFGYILLLYCYLFCKIDIPNFLYFSGSSQKLTKIVSSTPINKYKLLYLAGGGWHSQKM